MTYSEIVQLLSSHMVPSDDPNMPPGQSIPMLEKLSLVNCDKLQTETNTINTNDQADVDGIPPQPASSQLLTRDAGLEGMPLPDRLHHQDDLNNLNVQIE